ncbi:MAG: hypothetical protein CVU56_07780 [Deltaproteobacteria bacterium HGW-Deltaproteobacteria-14]|nr:MAG: hypothetical protein CVU56_07780 [Deltaproteobacteria bacterium HGW-Deltaproteobacteria-14]
MHRQNLVILGVIAALAGHGCGVDKLAPPTDAGAQDGDTASDLFVPDGVDAASGYTYCDPRAAEPGCPSGTFCETTSFICVDCVADISRCNPDGSRESCEAPHATRVGEVSGGFYTPDPCPSDAVCVQSGIRTSCEPVICDAGHSECVDASVLRCNMNGTEETVERCAAGRACYEGKCETIRHNVLLIFDTSGSMHDYIVPSIPTGIDCGAGLSPCPGGQACSDPDGGECLASGTPIQCDDGNHGPCVQPWPVCDDPSDPLTLFGLSKAVYADGVNQAIGGFAQFALQRFPQRESATNGQNCWLGWYAPIEGGKIAGDDGASATAPGGWFDAGMSQAFVVPFPPRNSLDNSQKILSWLDNVESLSATDAPCTTSADCAGGRCGTVNGEGRCFRHSNDELRAGGETPLGKSLFYAGEYFRRFVRVDGKPCARSADCGSVGYLCKDDVCVDPYRKCRDDFIILFTDGEESQFKTEADFFNPTVQARRLAFGLDCTADEDCRGGAVCGVDGMCSVPGADMVYAAINSGGYGALASPDGQPISIRTTVITLQADHSAAISSNRRIAEAGGGAHIDVTATDPDAFKAALIHAMSPNYKCEPEDL